MRLPGTRFQEHGWEQVRKLLGQCSLRAFGACPPALLLDPAREDEVRSLYLDLVAEALYVARAPGPGNSYGESVQELALSLVYELQAHGAAWSAFGAAVRSEAQRLGPFWSAPGGEASLRKKVNDMFAGLRDRVDADNYQAACGRPCSPNRIYAFRMLDTAYGEIARLFADWQQHAAQVGAILGRLLSAAPIEVRQMKSIGACKADWVLRWSASLEQFGGSPGPLHTRSKRFANLKDNPAKISAMLAEIGDYEELSSNRDRDWLQDAADCGLWLDDLERVLAESGQAASADQDQLLAAAPDEFAASAPPADPGDEADARALAVAVSVSLPPRYLQLAAAAQDGASWSARMMEGDSLPVRLAVYQKVLGGFDDSYPVEWLDAASGELPTMQQLAMLDEISLPTLRKRRDAAIARLVAAPTGRTM
ncbi:MAG: hypothetical protein V4508_19685 [Pseudomonadota bacterium]